MGAMFDACKDMSAIGAITVQILIKKAAAVKGLHNRNSVQYRNE